MWSSRGFNCEFSVILCVLDNMSKQGNAVQDDAAVQKLFAKEASECYALQ